VADVCVTRFNERVEEIERWRNSEIVGFSAERMRAEARELEPLRLADLTGAPGEGTMKKHNSHLPGQVRVFEGHNGFEKKTPCSIPQETLRRTLDCYI
jgi:hypothetical protein